MKPRPSGLDKQIAKLNGLCRACAAKKAERGKEFCKECAARRARFK